MNDELVLSCSLKLVVCPIFWTYDGLKHCRAGTVEVRYLPAGITKCNVVCANITFRREGAEYGTVPALQLFRVNII